MSICRPLSELRGGSGEEELVLLPTTGELIVAVLSPAGRKIGGKTQHKNEIKGLEK